MSENSFMSKYVSKEPDENGLITYTREENGIWKDLITRQLEVVEGRACEEFLTGLKKAEFTPG